MPSPFPGMNPYLERESVWSTFRNMFINGAQTQLVAQLSPGYIVRLELHQYVHEVSPERQGLDVADVEKLRSISIEDFETEEVVTVVELLSPLLKSPGPHREGYQSRRQELMKFETNLVEIDLLRGGDRTHPDGLLECDYYAVVSRAKKRPRACVWPWRLRDPMPVLPIPLREGEPETHLNLKAVIDHLYDAGFCEGYIYRGPPEPQLAPPDAAWAAQFLPAANS